MVRVLAIGDIHGCSTALETLLAAVVPQPEDTIVALGDYIDRGPDSKGVLNFLIELNKSHHLVTLRGNHEQMLLSAHTNKYAEAAWINCGGDATLRSYGSLALIPVKHWHFLLEWCQDSYETESHFFVHANAYSNIPLSEQPQQMLYWREFGNPQPHSSGKIMVCGHTSQKNGLPLSLGHAICIDTWVYGTGWLTCLDVTSGKIWQANQAAEHRQFSLEDLPE
jgi:serine/threonine protein phosphatase 1